MKRMVRSAMCGVLSLLAIIVLIGQPVRAQQNVFSIANAYLQVDVNTQNGNMTILTVQGDPTNPLDDNLAITDPEDTALILRLYNIPNGNGGVGTVDLDLRAGGTVGTVNYGLNVVELFPNMIRTRWLVYIPDLLGQLPPVERPSLVVERECVIVGDMVEIRIRVINKENTSRDIGIGVILDTGFNPPGSATQDTPGFFMVSNSSATIRYEREFTKAKGLPDFYLSLPLTGVGTLKGTINAGEGPLPDKVLFALVPSIQSAAVGYGFDYTPNPYNALAINIDSAVGLYWNRLALPAKGSVEVVTHLGVDIGPGDYRRPMSLRVFQPEPLEIQLGDDPFTPEVEQAYVTPNPFTITALVYNSLLTPLTNVSVTLGLPEGLSFPPGESATKVLPLISADGEQRVSWQVRVNPGTIGVKELVVTAYSPQVGSRQVRVPVVVPFLPVLELKRGYNLIGFPFEFVNPEPSAALGIPPEELKMATYDPSLRNYLVYRRDLQFNRIEPGQGYWLWLPTDRTLTFQDIRFIASDQSVVLPLRRGWNLLSNPFPWQVLLRGVEIRFGSDPVSYTFEEAVAFGWVKSPIFLWRNDPSIPPHGGEYVVRVGSNVRLDPFQGFWLYSEIDGNIIFGAPLFLGSWQMRGLQFNPERSTLNPQRTIWSVQVIATSAAGRDNTTWLGVSHEASNELDRLDLPKVPQPPGFVQVSSVLRFGRSEIPLSMDIRPPQGKIVWTLDLLNPAGGEVKLQFEGLAQVPRSVTLMVYDPETNQRWSLRTTPSLTVSTQPNQPKRLQLIALQSDQLPLRVQNLKVTPTRGKGAQIQFAVTVPSQVQVQIRTLTGRVVWETNEQVESGRLISVFWDGRSNRSELLPSSVYIVTVRAITEDGRQTQAQTILRWR